MRKGVKGYFFSLDAIFALFLLITGVVLITNIYTSDLPSGQISYYSRDMISLLSSTRLSDINNSYIDALVADGNITNLNNTIIEQIGIFWVTGRHDIARNLTENITRYLIPDIYGFSIEMGDDTVYKSGPATSRDMVTYKSLITGIEKTRPIKGTSARIYLSGAVEGLRSRYAYFGGFVGQGNITRFIAGIPSDAVINAISMEMSAGDNFSLYLNGIKCDDFLTNGDDLVADLWDISYCNDSVAVGQDNNLTIVFDDEGLNSSYLSGGYIRIDYTTDDIFTKDMNSDTFYLPGIYGAPNLYSGFSVPGELKSMDIFLHFRSNYTTYLTVGDRVVLNITGNGSDQNFHIDNMTLSSFPVLLEYPKISNTTVPVRFASFNTTVQTITEASNADVVIVTDLSGSMKCRMGQWDCPPVGNAIPNCKPTDLESLNSRRLGVAGCLDSQINDIIMNESQPLGNRLWLVDFSDNANPFYSNMLPELTHDNIEQEIDDRYKSKSQHEIQGGTCIACAINQAYEIFDTYSDNTRTKYLIVMTDGVATYCTGGSWEWNGTSMEWMCDTESTGTTRQWSGSGCTGDQDDCEVSDCLMPGNNAINASRRIHKDLNVTVHAVGIGPLEGCSMANYTIAGIADAANGTYLVSSNATELLDFYRTVGLSILSSTTLSSQKLMIKGDLTEAVLYGDSYIRYNYTTKVQPLVHGEFPIFLETKGFSGCQMSVNIPERIRIIDAKVSSYSSSNWTDHVSVTNSLGTFEVYNLSKYSSDYSRLGDPFILSIPPEFIQSGDTNTIRIRVGDSPDNSSACSDNNTFIYTGLINIINSTFPYSEVLEKAEGCNWTVELDLGPNISIMVPGSYSGAKKCTYTNASHDSSGYDIDDSYDGAMYSFLSFVDYNNDGRVFINFNENDLFINSKVVTDIPYLWGPTIAEVRVWQ